MKANPGYWLAAEGPIEYDRLAVNHKHRTHSASERLSLKAGQRAMAVLTIAFLSVTTIVYPLVGEIDPWHGHVVVGGTNRADRILALLNHRHTDVASHPHPVSSDSVVLSIAERAMLSSLADFAAETALVPAFTALLLSLFLIIALDYLAHPRYLLGGISPPSPPPRKLT